jgi:N,N'-diacetyllegionaminate synthase
MMSFKIGSRPIGGGRCFLIAEVAQAHDGSLGMAHAYIDAAAAAGVDAVKFQTHIAEAESTLDEPFRIKFSRQDETRFDYWKRLEFSAEQWAGLKAHADAAGVVFLSSPFSIAAIDLLERLGIQAWKVASGEMFSALTLRRLCQTNVPLLISTGMASYGHVAAACEVVKIAGRPFALFQCTTSYPTPLTEVGLNVIDELRDRFNVPVGLSDHSGTLYPSLMAMARGADMIEIHVTFSKSSFGPDVSSSIDFIGLKELVAARDAFGQLQAPLDKDKKGEGLQSLRGTFGKSWAPVSDLSAGTVLAPAHLTLKKPGLGFTEADLDQLVGRRLARDVSPLRLLKEDDLDPH